MKKYIITFLVCTTMVIGIVMSGAKGELALVLSMGFFAGAFAAFLGAIVRKFGKPVTYDQMYGRYYH